MTSARSLIDSHGRTMRDLRVSVTDRCNFRCLYCLPETEAALNFYRGRWAHSPASTPIARQWQPQERILSFEELERLIRIAAGLGIQKIRLTGGEPLLRRELPVLVKKIAAIPGIEDLALTTNGFLFQEQGKALREAGLQRVSFSLDSLEPENFKKITGRDGLEEVLASVDLAQKLGFAPVKINAVMIRGINDYELEALADFALARSLPLRFIEFMPLDSSRTWQKDLVIPAREILERLRAKHTLLPVISENKAETARRWRVAGSAGEIGIIAPVSEPFCGHCNRLRLMADGKLRTCLFSAGEHDFRDLLRSGADNELIKQRLREVVWQKEDRHHIGEPEFVQPERTMSCIGG